MKSLASALQTELYTYVSHRAAELYTIFFAEGTVYWTSADQDVVYGGITYLASSVVASKVRIVVASGTIVDALTIEIAPGAATVGGTPMVTAALSGSFAAIRVLVQRAYLDGAGAVIGAPVVIFDGTVDYPEPSSTLVKLHVKSTSSILNRTIPNRLIQPSCTWVVYDSNCAANPASHTFSFTTTTGSTVTDLHLTSSPSLTGSGHRVQITSGPLNGTIRYVRSIASSVVTLDRPLPSAPGSGVTLTIRRACPKSRTVCSGTFANLPNFGGAPDMPSSEVA